jgi:hypothetical protein
MTEPDRNMGGVNPEKRAYLIGDTHRRVYLQTSQGLHVKRPIVEFAGHILLTMNAFSFSKEFLFHKNANTSARRPDAKILTPENQVGFFRSLT